MSRLPVALVLFGISSIALASPDCRIKVDPDGYETNLFLQTSGPQSGYLAATSFDDYQYFSDAKYTDVPQDATSRFGHKQDSREFELDIRKDSVFVAFRYKFRSTQNSDAKRKKEDQDDQINLASGTLYWRGSPELMTVDANGWINVNAQFTTSDPAAASDFGRLKEAYISYSPDCIGMRVSD